MARSLDRKLVTIETETSILSLYRFVFLNLHDVLQNFMSIRRYPLNLHVILFLGTCMHAIFHKFSDNFFFNDAGLNIVMNYASICGKYTNYTP